MPKVSSVTPPPMSSNSKTRIGKECSSRVAVSVPPGPSLLSISSASEDHTVLGRILLRTPWHIAAARTCRAARALLHRGSVSAIVCAHDLPDGTWRDILNLSATSTQSPPVIVTSRVADGRLWAEVLNLGGYDVLAKPFHEQEVRHVLTSVANQMPAQ